MKQACLSVLIFILVLSGQVYATGLDPVVVDLGNGNKAVQLTVDGSGYSWMWIDFGDAVSTSEHSFVTASFDMYLPTGFDRLLEWGFVDDNDSKVTVDGDKYYGINDPYYGDVYNGDILPFGWSDADPGSQAILSPVDYQVPMVTGSWANITMEWDFINKEVDGAYNGSGEIHPTIGGVYREDLDLSDMIITDMVANLYGWDITLASSSTGLTSVLIDNLVITGSDIYSTDFDNFNTGVLNSQDGWISGTEAGATVPEPSALLLFGLGIIAAAGRARVKA